MMMMRRNIAAWLRENVVRVGLNILTRHIQRGNGLQACCYAFPLRFCRTSCFFSQFDPSQMLGVQRASIAVGAFMLAKSGAIKYRRTSIQIIDHQVLAASSFDRARFSAAGCVFRPR